VINLTEKAVITDDEGYFEIDGVAGDAYCFRVQYKSRGIV
jgi:hypothetical protein